MITFIVRHRLMGPFHMIGINTFLVVFTYNLHCPYFTERHQGTNKYINKDIWIQTHYKQTKTLSENIKQWYKIIRCNVEQK